VDFKLLGAKGKSYRWPRLKRCPGCDGRLWGHGYAARYFEGLGEAMWVKRFRCADCAAVHTARPQTHWRRFWAGGQEMVHSLTVKLRENRWEAGFSRQRQQYWWQGLEKQLLRQGIVGAPSEGGLFQLVRQSIIAATHSMKYFEIRNGPEVPYLRFAFTPRVGWG